MAQSFGRYSHHYERERPRDARCIVCGAGEDAHDKRIETTDRVVEAEVAKVADHPIVADLSDSIR